VLVDASEPRPERWRASEDWGISADGEYKAKSMGKEAVERTMPDERNQMGRSPATKKGGK